MRAALRLLMEREGAYDGNVAGGMREGALLESMRAGLRGMVRRAQREKSLVASCLADRVACLPMATASGAPDPCAGPAADAAEKHVPEADVELLLGLLRAGNELSHR
ncbi:hypothetical protein RM780_06910 [Streptomyces sp. DSM 44917]|uniref:Uncharacterized protein n=1 Tax=Streptomyces boetiae TaxID=3075541 RepID=A0ABU2L590_9ACTN|nr:hypothetical protein [Streptomyces sp. DSM 44917]MDT0306690.1 hypothetical protein [Streptomyces sp. DSM 44917]